MNEIATQKTKRESNRKRKRNWKRGKESLRSILGERGSREMMESPLFATVRHCRRYGKRDRERMCELEKRNV